MSDKQDTNNQIKVSRRDFLKTAAVTTGGVIAAVATADPVYAGTKAKAVPTLKEMPAQTFTDSVGRKTDIPKEITSVIPTGAIAQTLLITLCHEKMATLAKDIEADEEKLYFDIGKGRLNTLRETGSLYASQGRSVKTAQIATESPSVIIDAGEEKNDINFSLEYLQSMTNVPTIFVDATFGKLPDAYRTLGQLLNCEKRAEQLASYIETIHADVGKKRLLESTAPHVLYAANENGIFQRGDRTVQDDVIEYLGGVSVKAPGGSESDTMEAVVLPNLKVDYVIYNNRECYEQILMGEGKTYEIWASVPAIQNGMYAISPAFYHYWFGSSMLFTQTIGMLWLGKTIWPDTYNYNLANVAQEFYSLFYGRTLEKEILEYLDY